MRFANFICFAALSFKNNNAGFSQSSARHVFFKFFVNLFNFSQLISKLFIFSWSFSTALSNFRQPVFCHINSIHFAHFFGFFSFIFCVLFVCLLLRLAVFLCAISVVLLAATYALVFHVINMPFILLPISKKYNFHVCL